MEIYIMPSIGSIVYQIISLIFIGAVIYSWFLLVKALRIYIRKNANK